MRTKKDKLDFASFEDNDENVLEREAIKAGGRPKKEDKAKNRCLLYFTSTEIQQIEELAKRARRSTNAFIKDLILERVANNNLIN